MSELAKRTLTGLAYVALTLGAALAGPITTTLLFLPVCLLAAAEMHRLCGKGAPDRPATLPVIAAGVVYAATALSGFDRLASPLMAAAVGFLTFCAGAVVILLRKDAAPVHEAGALLLVILYVAVPFGLAPALLQHGTYLFIGFMLLLWTNDTGAYLVGRAVGRTPLLPRVSPKKTVEGLAGGLLLTVVAAVVLSVAWPRFTWAQWACFAVVVALASTLGDLLESAFKREAGVKDSGRVLPGHGGILDRFDGFLLALPAMLIGVEFLI